MVNLFEDFKKIRRRFSIVDFGFFTLPLVICIGFFLTPGFNEIFKLDLISPDWWQFFTSFLVHQGFSHFFGNFISLLICSIFSLLLSIDFKRKTKIYLISFFSFGFILLGVLIGLIEFILYSSFNIYPARFSLGSSGIASAFIVILPFINLRFAENSLQQKYNIWTFFVLISVYPAFCFVWSNLKTTPWFFTLFVTIMIFVFILLNLKFFRDIWIRKKELYKTHKVEFVSFVCAWLFFLLMIPPLLPSSIIISEGTLMNILVHYLGMFLGSFIGMLIIKD